MQGTSVKLDGEKENLYLERTSHECIDLIVERGFATNMSEAVRVALAWCALAIDAYDGLTERRGKAGPRRSAGEAGAPPQSGAARG